MTKLKLYTPFFVTAFIFGQLAIYHAVGWDLSQQFAATAVSCSLAGIACFIREHG